MLMMLSRRRSIYVNEGSASSLSAAAVVVAKVSAKVHIACRAYWFQSSHSHILHQTSEEV